MSDKQILTTGTSTCEEKGFAEKIPPFVVDLESVGVGIEFVDKYTEDQFHAIFGKEIPYISSQLVFRIIDDLRELEDLEELDWDFESIANMLKKAGTPGALLLANQTVEHFLSLMEYEEHRPLEMMEMGVGAGLTTVLLYKQTLEMLGKSETPKIIAVDSSSIAIESTRLLCEHFKIPVQKYDTIESIPRNATGVCLVQTKFNEITKDHLATVKGILSGHGLSYLNKVNYLEVMDKLPEGVPLVSDHLSTEISLALSKVFVAKALLRPSLLRQSEKDLVRDAALVEWRSGNIPEKFFTWLNFLVKHNFPEFKKMICFLGVSSSQTATLMDKVLSMNADLVESIKSQGKFQVEVSHPCAFVNTATIRREKNR